MRICKIVTILVLHFNLLVCVAQIDNSHKDHLLWFDSVIGQGSTGIYNGTLYSEQYRTEKGNHKYLYNQYINGNIIYDGQAYYNIPMKYDVFNDELIIRLPNGANHIFIKLFKEKISSFSIDRQYFINNTSINHESFGFFEQLYKGPHITLLKKHQKNHTEYIKSYQNYDRFRPNNYFSILHDGDYLVIRSRKDLTRRFPDLKKQISSYYRAQKQLLKLNADTFYINLMNEINTLLTQSN